GVCRVCSILVQEESEPSKEEKPVEPRLLPGCCTEVWTLAEAKDKGGAKEEDKVLRIHTLWSSREVTLQGEGKRKAGEYVRSAVRRARRTDCRLVSPLTPISAIPVACAAGSAWSIVRRVR